MDQCRYCREYHADFLVCKGRIKSIQEGRGEKTQADKVECNYMSCGNGGIKGYGECMNEKHSKGSK